MIIKSSQSADIIIIDDPIELDNEKIKQNLQIVYEWYNKQIDEIKMGEWQNDDLLQRLMDRENPYNTHSNQ